MTSLKSPRYAQPVHRRSGVTLIDTTITVLIISILAAAASPRFTDMLHRSRSLAAAQRVKADMNWVRQHALSSSTAQTVRFTPASDTYDFTDLRHLDNSGQLYLVDLSAAHDAELVAADLGGDGNVTFDLNGQPDSGGVITVQSGGIQLTVTINPDTGKASIP